MICLPSIARHRGVCLHCSPNHPNPTLTALFDAIGGVVTLSNEEEMNAAMMTCNVMGTFYGIMRRNRDWLMSNSSMSKRQASYLVVKQYEGMVADAVEGIDDEDRLDELIAEQTRGGLNEQGLANFERLKGLAACDEVSDAILSRLEGKTDGSLRR